VSAVCPAGFVVIGGGFTGVQAGQVTASDSAGEFNRWTVTVTGSNQPYVATAYCLEA
jgi:20S proteasome alpha/beta subunit